MGVKRLFSAVLGVSALGFPAFLFFSLLPRPLNRAEEPLKENLDLPFEAVGASEEEEKAPEILVFYGQIYEASTVVFALDESGSMSSNRRWELQSREVIRAIQEMSDEAEFGIVYYGSRVTAFRHQPVKASAGNKAAGIAFVKSRRPVGDTCLGEGVVKALQICQLSASNHRSVIVTSDGKPDNCATGNAATPAEIQGIFQKTRAANPGGAIRVHTIWVGLGGDDGIEFMRQLAEIHRGTFRKVSN